ncbi:MAG: hypothetical protein JF888_03890 [Candidatus Dormibacteraeota bacterium]|uniref:Uncharacterized protein n=1 Tax=Candidatus Dormiibacter inghamiae TaxID=3127013 RepID=A0A934K8B1_9BACT|nr:hypothetical protein [Candidatus Dormibacteraeota bacterium]MBJ7604930.1 hypothetical protein [Candidatus Dormibacteraeota bacterium]
MKERGLSGQASISAVDSGGIVLHLNSAQELFQLTTADMLSSTGRLVSGIEELIQRLLAGRLRPGLRATIVLPPDQLLEDTEERLRKAIHRYCQLRLQQTDGTRRAQLRNIREALGVGLLLFAVGAGLSFYFNQSGLPAFDKFVLGDQLALVIAWIGLWYPLDELVHYRRAMLRESKVLTTILKMDVAVVAQEEG